MFEYNGFQYTVDEVRKAASKLGISLEDYLAKNTSIKPISVEKQTGSTEDPTMKILWGHNWTMVPRTQ